MYVSFILVFSLHILVYHNIKVHTNIHRAPIGLIAVLVTWEIIHIPFIVIFITLYTYNSCLIIFQDICIKYIIFVCVSLIPANFILHSLYDMDSILNISIQYSHLTQ